LLKGRSAAKYSTKIYFIPSIDEEKIICLLNNFSSLVIIFLKNSKIGSVVTGKYQNVFFNNTTNRYEGYKVLGYLDNKILN